MALPFWQCSSRRLDEIVNHGLLCAFDLHRTLAPAAGQVGKVRVPLGTVLRLFELSTYTPLVIITPRAPADVYACLEFEPDFVLDSHTPERGSLDRLMHESGARSLIYVGNDLRDEDLMRCQPQNLLSVGIGLGHSREAQFFLPHGLEVFPVLDELIGRLRRARAMNWIHGRQGVADPR
jgi:hypothetical protein